LEYLARKLGVSKAAEAVGASKRIFYRMPRCESPIDGASLEKILSAKRRGRRWRFSVLEGDWRHARL